MRNPNSSSPGNAIANIVGQKGATATSVQNHAPSARATQEGGSAAPASLRRTIEGEGLTVSARLRKGRFRTWREAWTPPSSWSARVDSPRLREAVKGLSRITVPGERTMGVRLEGLTLTLTVANAEAGSSAIVPVRNISERPGEVATIDIDPRYLLSHFGI